MKKFKKVISILTVLCLIFTLAPVTALADTGTITESLVLTGNHDDNGDGWDWDGESGTLILEDLNLETEDEAGIILPEGDVEIVLKGKNSIKTTGADAIYGNDTNLTISGGGKLTIESDCSGIFIGAGDIVIEDGEITISSSWYDDDMDGTCAAIFAVEGDVIINGGIVKINALEWGILATEGDVIINDGKISIGTDEDGTVAAQGFSVFGGDVIINDGELSIISTGYYEGEEAYENEPVYSYKYGYNGISVNEGNVVINGGDVHIKAVGDFEEDVYGYNGIYAYGGDVAVKGGTVKITAGSGIATFAPGTEAGIGGNVTIENGTLTIVAGLEAGIDAYGGDISITGGSINITAVEKYEAGEYVYGCNGITASGGDVAVKGGTIKITAGSGIIIPASVGEDVNGGNVTIENGALTIAADLGAGIGAYGGNVVMKNGTVDINALYGVYAGENVAVSGGTFDIDAAYTGIGGFDVAISGGTVNIDAGVTGVDGFNTAISGGDTQIAGDDIGISAYGYYDKEFVGGQVKLSGGKFDITGKGTGAVVSSTYIYDVGILKASNLINQITIKNVTIATDDPQNGKVAAIIEKIEFEPDGEEEPSIMEVGIVTFTKNGDQPKWELNENDETINTNVCKRVYTTTSTTSAKGGGGGSSASSYTVKFNSNGGTDVRTQYVAVDGKVSTPVAPQREGFILEGWYTDEALTKKYDFNTTVTGSFTLYAKWTAGGAVTAAPGETLRFNDIASHWARSVILSMADKGIINGYTDSSFKPDNPITRAEYLTMMVKALGVKATAEKLAAAGAFADAAQIPSWAAEYVAIGKALGIVEGGTSGNFNPYSQITRQDMFVMTYRALLAMEVIEVSSGSSALTGYTDRGDIAAYAAEALQTLAEKDLVAGSGGKLNPKKNATRAEAAQFLSNILDYVAATPVAPADDSTDAEGSGDASDTENTEGTEGENGKDESVAGTDK